MRSVVPAISGLETPPRLNPQLSTVLLVVHEASLSGEAVLGWNIVRRLSGRNVVTVMMRGGALEEHFAAVSSSTVGPLVGQQWHAAEVQRLAERLVATYRPLYTIANGIETHLLIPALARLGVPSVALVHELAADTHPLYKMRDVLHWAAHVVFPTRLVADSSYTAFPGLARRRGVHTMLQGRSERPGASTGKPAGGMSADRGSEIARLVRPDSGADAFVVLGLGHVEIRKGTDLFLATAEQARRLAPGSRFRFVWISAGDDPVGDSAFSIDLAEQIVRSHLTDTVAVLDAIEDLDPAYANADLLLMCSGFDSQPNIAIDALTRGIPAVCFDSASATAEVLSSDPETRSLVVPQLDAYAAAEVICRLARDPEGLANAGRATARVGTSAYDMAAYVSQVDEWGQAAAAALRAEDLQTLADAHVVDARLALPSGVVPPGVLGLERHVLQQWAIVGTCVDQVSNWHFRRPCAGFHPQVYAQAHPDACVYGHENPLAHWLRAGRPNGPWSREVFSPLDPLPPAPAAVRVALHAHLHYTLSARDLATRLAGNNTRCDLFVSTDTRTKAEEIQSAFATHAGAVDVRIMPNRGRDVGPFLTGLAREITSGDYDVFGHIHGKQSLSTNAAIGNLWREFLWENLIGGAHPMLDLVAAIFATRPDIGLLMAEDPHLVGWEANRAIVETLGTRVGVALPLDDFFDFPLGNMFWARPRALQPLLALNLVWDDYPAEPVPRDGTLLHALERLTPYAARRAGLSVAGLRSPGTTW